MYYWDGKRSTCLTHAHVSVVVRRMYYWDEVVAGRCFRCFSFSSCQKNVLLGLTHHEDLFIRTCFSSCQKNVLLGPGGEKMTELEKLFQQLLEECTIGTLDPKLLRLILPSFSSCQKNVLLGHSVTQQQCTGPLVSVVVRRMYYWDVQRFGQFINKLRFSSCQKNVLLGL